MKPPEGSLQERFEQVAAVHPERTAVVCGHAALSYAELNDAANRIAHRLRDLGVAAGDPVGLCIDRSADMVVAMLAILKAGAAYVPLDTGYPADRLSFITRDSGLRMVVGYARNRSVLDRDDITFLALDDAGTAPVSSANPPPTATGASVAYVIYTSGSTGVPKGVLATQANVRNLVLEQNYLTIEPDDRLSAMASLSFDASTLEIWGALLNGAACHIYDFRNGDVTALFETMWRDGITIAALTSAVFRMMGPAHFALAKGIRAIFFGGDSVRTDTVAAARELYEGELLHVYGPTETTSFCTFLRASARLPGTTMLPIGGPIRGVGVRVLDERGVPAAVGTPGELCIAGRGVALGYLNRPELTGQRFVPDRSVPGERLYRTGDLVRMDEDGVLHFLGRMDRQVKIRGHRVEPGEIEAAIVRHAGVQDAVVVARPDSAGDKRLHAYLVAAAGGASDRELVAEVRRDVTGALPAYQHPATYTVIETIPYTANLKLDEARLPDPGAAAGSGVRAVPEGELEATLTGLWQTALDLPEFGVHDNFFESGGDSLLALKLSLSMEQALGVRFASGVILKYPTVRTFADAVAAGRIGVPTGAAGSAE